MSFINQDLFMSTYTIIPIAAVDPVCYQQVHQDEIDYAEYAQMPLEARMALMVQKITRAGCDDRNMPFAVVRDNKVVSVWVITNDFFDTEIFGIDIYRISYLLMIERQPSAQDEIIKKALSYIQSQVTARKTTSYFLIGLNTNMSNTPYLLNRLAQSGFHYIHTLLTYKMAKAEYAGLRVQTSDSVSIRKVTPADSGAVMELARKSFKFSRYHLDPYLDKEKANNLLATSAENSILHGFVDVMYIAEHEGKVVGYYSGKKRSMPELSLNFGEAVISAVDENYRGGGIFKTLNGALLKWFYENTDIAEMGTYLSNIPVHKTWSNNGLSIIRGTHQLAVLMQP